MDCSPKTKRQSLKLLKLSLKYRPKIYRLILKLRETIRKKNKLISEFHRKTEKEKKSTQDTSCQTEESNESDKPKSKDQGDIPDWKSTLSGETEKPLAEQVKEAAQNALAETGMVYVESAGMYYDYKTGYYYNTDLGLYYHTDTNCYYTYSEDKKTFEFHSYPDMSKTNLSLIQHEKKKAKKHKQVGNKEDQIDLLSQNLARVTIRQRAVLDVVAKHHPPCMRIIVKETKLAKLKVGTLYLITKDGGTIGREGSHHSIVLKEHNVSRDHLEIKYDMDRHTYVAIDLGSKNGTILNGNRMCASQTISQPLQIPHGSTIQLGETKLLCHIHPGNDTCGHCEPGLIMAAEEKQKTVAYTRTCSVQKQHQLELARLKNKYAPQLLAIEDGNYNDRAKTRRETVGSSHNSEKTQQSDLETSIPSENKGFKLLEKMGWAKGEGLGKDSQGDTEPIPLVSNDTKAGLGAIGSAEPVKVGSIGQVQLQRRMVKKPLRPPAKLFRDPLEEDD